MFILYWAKTAQEAYLSLKTDLSQEKRFKAVRKAIRQLAQDPHYPGLQSHPFVSMHGANGEKVFESYAENNTSAAYRIFWYYGETRGTIYIVLITPHP